MHILVLSHYYPPEVNAPASRVSENAREWVRLGHKVTVVTCAPNHPRGEIYPGFENRFSAAVEDGVEVIRIWTYLAANAGFARRIANYLSFPVSLLFPAWLLSLLVVLSRAVAPFHAVILHT